MLSILALADIGLCLIGLLRGAVYGFSVPAFLTLAAYAAAIFFSGGKELFNLKKRRQAGGTGKVAEHAL